MKPESPTFHPISRPLAGLLAGLFCGVLILPGLVNLSGLEPSSPLVEKRSRNIFPDLRTAHPMQQLRNILALRGYFNDRFGLRAPLIELNARLRVETFRVRVADRVVIGEAPWLFLKNGAENNPVTMPAHPFSDSELKAWQGLFEQRRDRLHEQGIPYLVLIAPNKASVYAEYLPDIFRGVDQGGRFRQLKQWMAIHSDVPIIDLHAVMEAHKDKARLYYPADTHWNARGAFWTSRRLHRAMGIADSLPGLDTYIVQVEEKRADDLVNLLGLPGSRASQKFNLVPAGGVNWVQSACTWDTRKYAVAQHKPFATEVPGKTLRVLVYRDSFATGLQPFISEFAGRAVFVWSYVHDPAIAEAEQPDWVIDAFIERRLTVEIPEPVLAGD
jgi:hypothetical protein